MNPASGPAGTEITINGRGFSAVPAENKVKIGGIAAPVLEGTSNYLKVLVPVGASNLPVTVTVNGHVAGSPVPFYTTYEKGGDVDRFSFGGGVTYSEGSSGVQFVVAADFNGDGKTDLASHNNTNYDRYLVTRPNISSPGTLEFGGIRIAAARDANTRPTAMTVEDLDGDGLPDLVITHSTRLISILRNTSTNGIISFSAKDLFCSSVPTGIAIADLNGDGRQDIAISTEGGYISIYSNNSTSGDIAVAAEVKVQAGSALKCIAATDVNEDGLPDLVAGASNGMVAVFRNVGNASQNGFAEKVEFAGGDSPLRIAVGDLNQDGLPDFALSNNVNGHVYILRNTSVGGSVGFSSSSLVIDRANTEGISIADLNGDGKPDIAVGNYNLGTLVAQNTGAGGNISFAPFFTVSQGSSRQAVVADLDGDGKPDLIGAAAYLYTWRNISTEPAITGFTPSQTGYGGLVHIFGQHFTPASTVKFGGVPADAVQFISDSLLHARVGQGAASVVEVTTEYGTGKRGSFGFVTTPFIQQVVPREVKKGDTLTITGYNLHNTSAIKLGGDPVASFIIESPSTVKAVAGTGGTGIFELTTGGGTVQGPHIRFDAAPVVTGFLPAAAKKGDLVEISGKHLSTLKSVSFGGVPADTFYIINDGKVTARVGEGTGGNVAVTTEFGLTSLAGFTYIPVPVIASIAPVAGIAGQTVTITGLHFTGATAVEIAGAPVASFQVVSSTRIIAVLGEKSWWEAGAVDVTTPSGKGSGKRFTYSGAPLIDSFTPASDNGNDSIYISGANFTGVSAVHLGENVLAWRLASDTLIVAKNIAVAPGIYPVKVTAASGEYSLDGYYSGPVIEHFTPASAIPGATVTLTGRQFNRVPADNIVYFGAVRATVQGGDTASLVVTVPAGATEAPVTVAQQGAMAYAAMPFRPTFAGGDTGFMSTSFIRQFTMDTKNFVGTPRIADMDGDGQPDVVVANTSPGGIYIYRNTSTAAGLSFAAAQNFNTYSNVFSATTADFNGDGKLDVAVANGYNYSVSILINNSTPGSLQLQLGTKLNTNSAQPLELATGDFDGDGRTDIAVGSYSSSILVYRNISSGGTIAFAPGVSYEIISSSSSLFVRDMNGDGKADIVTANRNTQTVSIFPNTSLPGNISFGPRWDMSASSNLLSMATGDIDGDGRPDVVATAYNYLYIFPNAGGHGKMAFKTPVQIAATFMPNAIELADLDGDARLDVAVRGEALEIYKNSSSPGNFSLREFRSFFTYGSTMSAGDMDGDGKPEIVCSFNNGTYSKLEVMKNHSAAGLIPVITSFSPAQARTGDTILITGHNLGAVTDVIFGNTAAAGIKVIDSTKVEAIVGNGSSGEVRVVTAGSFAAKAGFSMLPDIISYSPGTGAQGDIIVIKGSGLSGAQVTFGKMPAYAVLQNNDTMLKVVLGKGATGHVVVSAATGKDSLPGFRYTAVPDIVSFAPATAGTGEKVIIQGSALSNVDALTFGGTAPNSWHVTSDSTIEAVIGEGSSGYVVIKSIYGKDSVAGFVFRETIPVPVISSFAPHTGNTGTIVTIRGSGLNGATQVSFGNTSAPAFSVQGDTLVLATVGAGSTGDVKVTTVAGTASLAGFTYIVTPLPPVITYFEPQSGGKDSIIYISGYNLEDITAVTFGGVPAAAFTLLNDSTIAAKVGNGSTGPIAVSSAAGVASKDNFTFVEPPAVPVIDYFSPQSGGTDSIIIISGSNLGGMTAVTFGDVPAASFTVMNDNTIAARVGSGATGPIAVSSAAGVASKDNFTFVEPPAVPFIDYFSPQSGGKDSIIVISGYNLGDVTGVTFGGVPALSFTVMNGNKVLAKVGNGGTGAVEVSSAAGTMSKNGFSFILPPPPPVIYYFSPENGSTGTTVAIRGKYFKDILRVKFGNTDAEGFTLLNDSTIVAVVGSGGNGAVSVSGIHGVASFGSFGFLAVDEKIFAYPNPAKGLVWLDHPPSASGSAGIKVFDLHGNLMHRVKPAENSAKTLIDLRSAPNGYYSIQWTDGTITRKYTVLIMNY